MKNNTKELHQFPFAIIVLNISVLKLIIENGFDSVSQFYYSSSSPPTKNYTINF